MQDLSDVSQEPRKNPETQSTTNSKLRPHASGLKWLLLVLCFVGAGVGVWRMRPASVTGGLPGLFSPQGSTRFEEIAARAGINYKWMLARRPTNILESVGQGCAFLDINNDGNLDILLVGRKLALYLGDGKGHFTDVTRQYGLEKISGEFEGCCVGDYDNDGFDDVYISGYNTGVLLHNEQGQTLRDVTKQMKIYPQKWGTSCAFVDVDHDGKLDLFICNYVDFGPGTKQNCLRNGKEVSCGPLDYAPLAPTLYHNLGGKFEDVTDKWQIASNGGGLGVACADYDHSGHDSIAIANDLRLGDLLHVAENKKETKQLVNMGMQVGVAGNMNGRPHAGMGIDWGDVNNDGQLDLVVMTYQREPRSLYINTGDGVFHDVAMLTGLLPMANDHLSFGVKFLDVDNDGWLDLLVANGHVQDNVAEFESQATFHQNTMLLHNTTGDRPNLIDISGPSGLEAMPPIVGRGLAIGDFDNDGRMDALVTNADGAPQLLHNVSTDVGHWLLCRLAGTKSNRDGIGAMLTFDVSGHKLTRRCGADGSFLSSSDLRVHVGLGSATQTTVTVHWPSGGISTFKDIKADQVVTLREP